MRRKTQHDAEPAAPKEARTFNERYDGIAADSKEIQTALRKILPTVRKLARRAERLYRYGDARCYTDERHSVQPVPGIERLECKMSLLDQLSAADRELAEMVAYLDMMVD